ncbi:MAG: regulatory protein GemA [Candidatus Edwardsbacteria bacterium]|nr:regulatory protein GemA [Candidatus Edwardsbacteria bacterium]
MSAQIITWDLVKKIHTIKGAMKLTEGDYRAMLGGYGVDTCKDLQYSQAVDMLDKLETQAVSMGVWEKRSGKGKYEGLGNRPGKAAPSQLRMIEAMWAEVSRQDTAQARAEALGKFVKRITGIDHITWLGPADVRKVARALQTMKTQKRETANE